MGFGQPPPQWGRGLSEIFWIFLPRNGAFCVHSDTWLDSSKNFRQRQKQIISVSVFKVISITVSVSFFTRSFLYVYSISIENPFSISFSISFTDINHFSISLSFSYRNITACWPLTQILSPSSTLRRPTDSLSIWRSILLTEKKCKEIAKWC